MQVEQVGDASIVVVPFRVELFGVEPILDLSTLLEKRFLKSMCVSRLGATSLEESMFCVRLVMMEVETCKRVEVVEVVGACRHKYFQP